MQIIYFIHCFPPALGGLEYLSGEIIALLRRAGHEVYVITGRGYTLDSYKTFSNWVNTSYDPAYIHRLALNFSNQRWANRILNKLIFLTGTFSPWYFGPILKYDKETLNLIKKADLIIGAGMPTKMIFDAFYFASKYKKRLILHPSYHNISYYNNSIYFQKAFNYANKVIYQTPHEKIGLQNNYKISDDKLVQLTFCPYELEDWHNALLKYQKRQSVLQNKFINHKSIIIGYIGQITLRKNFDTFIKLINITNNKLDLKYIFAGARTNSSEQVKSLFKPYKSKVKFIYDFPKSDINNIFDSIDVFINPSTEESLGLVNFEALFNGLVCYLPDKTAFNTLFDLNNELLTQENNPLYSLMESLSLRMISVDQIYNQLIEYNRSNYSNSFKQIISEFV